MYLLAVVSPSSSLQRQQVDTPKSQLLLEKVGKELKHLASILASQTYVSNDGRKSLNIFKSKDVF